ncbi:hypothetical protein RZS28_17220 [Methylocapsa polymorpha]|uniref:Glycosyl transferase family 2 n=1 Tax=Methylocapsa polymorpha TaxID=3080828 RepID=A0ABZ0HRS4_9HYPH|nr:hypothetical protein RZS28_17220 [Methylocapsa sp. RX1]
MRTAIIILNRNMPDATDQLVENFLAYDTGNADVFVVESGSNQGLLSKYCSWWADWPEAMRDGLRYPRGFNYGLSQILKGGKFRDYTYFFLVCNDVEISGPLVAILVEEMERHTQVGIISPCAANWAESELIGPNNTRYVCHGNHVAWLLRRDFIEAVMERDKPDYMNFLYDGTNFRGYYADQELIIKGYVNHFASAITTKAVINERTELLKTRHDLIRTDRYEINLRRVFEEGQQWMHRKYGFSTRFKMNMYAEMFYENFFTLYPSLAQYRL